VPTFRTLSPVLLDDEPLEALWQDWVIRHHGRAIIHSPSPLLLSYSGDSGFMVSATALGTSVGLLSNDMDVGGEFMALGCRLACWMVDSAPYPRHQGDEHLVLRHLDPLHPKTGALMAG